MPVPQSTPEKTVITSILGSIWVACKESALILSPWCAATSSKRNIYCSPAEWT